MPPIVETLFMAVILFIILSQLRTSLGAFRVPSWFVLLIIMLIVVAFASVPFNTELTEVFAAPSGR